MNPSGTDKFRDGKGEFRGFEVFAVLKLCKARPGTAFVAFFSAHWHSQAIRGMSR